MIQIRSCVSLDIVLTPQGQVAPWGWGQWQHRAWQPRLVPLPQPVSGQLGTIRTAPALGTGHLCGDGPRLCWDISQVMWVRIRPGEELCGQTQHWGGWPGPLHAAVWGSLPMDTSRKGLHWVCLGAEPCCQIPRTGEDALRSLRDIFNKGTTKQASAGNTEFITGFIIIDR